MSTQRTFQAMLNDYLPNELLKEELIARDYVLNKVDKDDGWVGASGTTGNGGNLVVAFKAGGASSVSFGQLSATGDIAQDNYQRGVITTQQEVWGSMIFNHRDIMEHETVSEKNFLKLLPDAIEDFSEYMKNVVSTNLLNGPWFATLSADATAATGIITVDRPDRFVIGQKVTVDDTAGLNPLTGYVSAIDINQQLVTLVTARGGSTGVDFSVFTKTVANTSKCYNDNARNNSFASLRLLMLSALNGGTTTIYGVTKTLYPFTQAINIQGNDITAANIVEKCFDGYTVTRRFGKGAPTDILMSLRNLGFVMKVIEASKGAYNVATGSKKASQYGWTEITVGSVTNQELKFIGIQEMDEDIVIFMDWRAVTFYSNGFFRKRKSPDGIEYFEVRATNGYQYVVDICLFGELVLKRPSYCGILYGISIP